MIYASM